MNTLQKSLRFWPWLAAILSGVLCTACFPPFNQTWLCWVALTPLIAAVWFSGKNSKRRWLRDLLLGYVAGVMFFTAAFSWLGALGTLFENFWLHGLSLLLSIYLGLNFAFWSWFCGLLRPPVVATVPAADAIVRPSANKWSAMLERAGRPGSVPKTPWLRSTSNLRLAFLLACAWVAHEWIRGWLFTGFGWNGLGIALHENWPLIQIAEFTGVAGLSFMVVFANVIALTTVRRLIFEARAQAMRPHYDLTLTMAAIVGVLGFGVHIAQNPPPEKTLRVAAVQANVPQQQKFDSQFTGKIFDQFTRLSEIALLRGGCSTCSVDESNPPSDPGPPLDLLIWPESSMPSPVLQDEQSHQFVVNLSASTTTDLLLGTLDVEEGRDYNAALLVSDAGQNVQIYRKIHLVPFGEYIPLRHSFPLFALAASKWVPGDFAAGKDYTVFRLTNRDVQVAPLICFEDTIGELTRQFVLKGANLLVDITNDGWFLHSAGSQQHLLNAIFRCVETRRPMVRAANTGVTCFVNGFGRVMQPLQDASGSTFAEGVLTGEIGVPTEHELTFYTRHGELLAKVCTCVTLIAIVVMIFLRRRQAAREN